jgi:hypothetical protein
VKPDVVEVVSSDEDDVAPPAKKPASTPAKPPKPADEDAEDGKTLHELKQELYKKEADTGTPNARDNSRALDEAKMPPPPPRASPAAAAAPVSTKTAAPAAAAAAADKTKTAPPPAATAAAAGPPPKAAAPASSVGIGVGGGSCSGCAHCLRHALIESVTRWLDAQHIGSLAQLRETYPQFWGEWERPGATEVCDDHHLPVRALKPPVPRQQQH